MLPETQSSTRSAAFPPSNHIPTGSNPLALDSQQIIHLNVGGQRFSTSRSTLSWVPDTFFTSLLSGRITSVEDGNGAIFIDRDPDLFRRILNYLRTKQVDLSNVNLSMLKHEAEFYGIGPLVKRLQLCEEMDNSPCGDVLFHAYIPAPIPPPILDVKSFQCSSTSSNSGFVATSESVSRLQPQADSFQSSSSRTTTAAASAILTKFKMSTLPLTPSPLSTSFSKSTPISSQCGRENSPITFIAGSKKLTVETDIQAVDGKIAGNGEQSSSNSPPFGSPYKTHSKKNSCDLTKQVRNELSNLLKQTELSSSQVDSMRVRIIRAHHNSVAVAYYNFVCCYKMKDSMGWQLIYVSPRMDYPIGHIALVSKFGGGSSQVSEKMLAIGLANNSVHLYCLDENNELESNRKVGTFSLSVQIDKLFFIGNQLVALSKTGKVGIWHSMTLNWQVQDVMQISCYDTAGSVLLLGCTNGSIYYFDMQKFPLRMKDNDLLITELYKDPNADVITAISVYLTPKTNLCGNWIEIAYGTNTGCVRVIVQHPETVGHGPQLFQTFTVHTAPITRVALTTNHLISVCSEYNHVRSWSVTRFRGMISTQPGGTSLASFKVVTLDAVDDALNCEGCDPGPYGDQDGDQIFVQRIVPDTNLVFVRLASNGERLCTIRAVDGSAITAFFIHECEGSNRMGARPRRYLFTGMANGSIQMWDLTTAMDQHNSRCQLMSALSAGMGGAVGTEKATTSGAGSSSSPSGSISGGIAAAAAGGAAGACFALNHLNLNSRQCLAILQGPTPEELLQLIDECELCSASLNSTPAITPHASALNLSDGQFSTIPPVCQLRKL
ncbi:BTB/POZ domain-containing protein [Ditylenchus destructor]|nr:BTB/POZ domain-containing protein [Ditylenchus destructor]